LRIGIVAPPFIPVPPNEYGGTELFIGDLASALQAMGVDIVLYTNGESSIDVQKKFLFRESQWPLRTVTPEPQPQPEFESAPYVSASNG